MNRIALTGTFLFAAAAWLLLREQNGVSLVPPLLRARRPVPAQEAAAKLHQAWADHHTLA